MSYDDLMKVRNLGKKSCEEVIRMIESLGVSLRMTDDAEQEEISSEDKKEVHHYILIEELNLSVRPFNNLMRVGIRSVDDLLIRYREANGNFESLGIGKKSWEEISEKLKLMHINL